ncbi:MAG TPA: hypothetical protein PKL21_10680 [Anaerolineaceae bacterium]|nr:hypothetical protein [Anaerolineaceae bacterium]
MKTLTLMNPSKETDNKLRWQIPVDDTVFAFYIPKWRVPTPWPARIRVIIDDDYINSKKVPDNHRHPDYPIKAIVKLTSLHTKTCRYTPSGDNPKDWEIGEPYIPYSLIPLPPPNTLYIEVRWDYSNGTWE